MERVERRHWLSRSELRIRRGAPWWARVSPLGWLFALAALGWLAIELRQLLEPGALDEMHWGDAAGLVSRTIGTAAVIALPAGLALGYPGVARRNRWLWRGAVLLAVAEIGLPVVRLVRERVIEAFDPDLSHAFDVNTRLGFAFVMLNVAVAIIALTGTWALSDGLADAGARPRRVVVFTLGAIGAAVVLTVDVRFGFVGTGSTLVEWGISILSVVLNAASFVLWLVIAGRLIEGWRVALVPRRAWAIGLVCGVLVLVDRAYATVAVLTGTRLDPTIGLLSGAAESSVWVLLLVAFAAGLGRGRRPRRHQFQLWTPPMADPAADAPSSPAPSPVA